MRALRTVEGLEGRRYDEQLRSLGLFSPEQMKLRRGLFLLACDPNPGPGHPLPLSASKCNDLRIPQKL